MKKQLNRNYWVQTAMVGSLLFGAIPAQAETLLTAATKSLIAFGITDRATVVHNLGVYEAILSGIESNQRNPRLTSAQKRDSALTSLENLEDRLDSQLGVIGWIPGATDVLAPRTSDAIAEAKIAVRAGREDVLARQLARAKTEIRAIRAAVK